MLQHPTQLHIVRMRSVKFSPYLFCYVLLSKDILSCPQNQMKNLSAKPMSILLLSFVKRYYYLVPNVRWWIYLLNPCLLHHVLLLLQQPIYIKKLSVFFQLGLIFYICIFWATFSMWTTLMTFPMERQYLAKERAADMYRLSAYYMSSTVCDCLAELVFPTIFLVILYFMASLRASVGAFFLTLLATFLIGITGQALNSSPNPSPPPTLSKFHYMHCAYNLTKQTLWNYFLLPWFLITSQPKSVNCCLERM